ncbi:MAG: 1-aminocyclopropane-1-carboxylate deaminase/D-cysteine desulfhydrase [Bacteroidia bacterium]|nr:1-aminocyclopropane-1-carboxylate deaminase/D-cysteine desulfhydrase [Bacteroidia bacterium]
MIPLQPVELPVTLRTGIRLQVLRLDLLHPEYGGNKWFKLKFNIERMRREGKNTLLTYGGAHSNHIAATAAAGKEFGFKTIGIIRGDELNPESNATLRRAAEQGMDLHFLTREQYRNKHRPEEKKKILEKFGDVYHVPEGGANEEATRGCAGIIAEIHEPFDFIVCACGTGSTLAGLITSLEKAQMAIGIPVLSEAQFLEERITGWVGPDKNLRSRWKLYYDYSFGRYGAITPELRKFAREFREDTGIPLDCIYTAKMMWGLLDLTEKGVFMKGEKVIALHTGGLQGNRSAE